MLFPFTNASLDDYTLTSLATAAINRGSFAGVTNTGFSLVPVSMYQSFNTTLLPRVIIGAAIDRGADEYSASTSVLENQPQTDIVIYPNPATEKIQLVFSDADDMVSQLEVFNSIGERVYFLTVTSFQRNFEMDFSGLSKGVYFVKTNSNKGVRYKGIVLQ